MPDLSFQQPVLGGMMSAMADDDAYKQWLVDGGVLAQIGAEFAKQATGVEVRLPRALADLAVASWQRDDELEDLDAESTDQRAIRCRAAALSLIGATLEVAGQPDGDEVVVRLDAWFVGDALNAADDAGLLT